MKIVSDLTFLDAWIRLTLCRIFSQPDESDQNITILSVTTLLLLMSLMK
jgi:hypothetical protein